jgi:hypothetical protein
MLDPIAGWLVVRQTGDLARSALPDAPVIREPERVKSRRVRRRAALFLRRLADRLEPAPRTAARAMQQPGRSAAPSSSGRSGRCRVWEAWGQAWRSGISTQLPHRESRLVTGRCHDRIVTFLHLW